MNNSYHFYHFLENVHDTRGSRIADNITKNRFFKLFAFKMPGWQISAEKNGFLLTEYNEAVS